MANRASTRRKPATADDLAAALRRAALKAKDPAVKRWLERLASGESYTSSDDAPTPTAKQATHK